MKALCGTLDLNAESISDAITDNLIKHIGDKADAYCAAEQDYEDAIYDDVIARAEMNSSPDCAFYA
jgi:hypothetical protein